MSDYANRAALHAAQEAWESPPDEDPDWITEDEATERAQGELLSTPCVIAQFLQDACDMARDDLDWHKLSDRLFMGARELSVPELLVLIIEGCNADAIRARHVLRGMIIRANTAAIKERAEDILDKQDRMIQRQQDDYLADLED